MSALLALLFIVGCTTNGSTGDAIVVTMYKSPNCGCCTGHAAALKQDGYTVNVLPTKNMQMIKEQQNIPSNMQSCHTSLIGDYFVEGHVPLEAIEKLLTEQPDIDGIALPRMPTGTPGMPGSKKGPYVIYTLKDGQPSEFMVI